MTTRLDVYVLVLEKSKEHYVALYDQANVREVQRTFGRWAANPELSFNWADAGELVRHMLQQGGTPLESVPCIPAAPDAAPHWRGRSRFH